MAKFGDERVRAVIEGPRAFRAYPFPGDTGDEPVRVAMRVLTESELDECRMAAQSELRDRAKTRGWAPESMIDVDPELMQRATERHIIFRATYDVDTIESKDPARFFATPAEVASLDSVTTTALAALYLEHQEWCSPLRQMSDEEIEELTAALGKSQMPEVFLGAFAPSTLRRFALSLACRLRSET